MRFFGKISLLIIILTFQYLHHSLLKVKQWKTRENFLLPISVFICFICIYLFLYLFVCIYLYLFVSFSRLFNLVNILDLQKLCEHFALFRKMQTQDLVIYSYFHHTFFFPNTETPFNFGLKSPFDTNILHG